MSVKLYDFQQEDVDKFINEKHKAGLFAYDMALGKTLTATTLAVRLGTGINLIIAPQVTFDGWEKAVHTQTDGESELQWLKKSSKAGLAAIGDFYAKKPGWYFITWQLMRGGLLIGETADMVIADEVHEIQNKGGSDQNILIGHINTTYRVGLSGTASGNKLSGIYGVISWLWPKKYKAYWSWLKRHFLLAGSGYQLTPIREITPGSVTSELPFYVRRLKDDHYSDMIPKPLPLQKIMVELNQEQRRVYDQFDNTSGVWMDEDDVDAGFLFTKHSIVKTGKLREIALGTPVMGIDEATGKYTTMFEDDAESSKMDALEQIIESCPGETFVIYTHSKKFIPVVIERLNQMGVMARPFTGDLNYKQKRNAIDELGVTYQVMVATQASVGTGTDGLQHKASKLVWLSRDVKVSTNTQARDRLYRPGQKERIEQWEIVANGTNDLDTNANIDYHEEVVNNMLDANRIKK
jgi:SNF2 family DNA or RNA helicase